MRPDLSLKWRTVKVYGRLRSENCKIEWLELHKLSTTSKLRWRKRAALWPLTNKKELERRHRLLLEWETPPLPVMSAGLLIRKKTENGNSNKVEMRISKNNYSIIGTNVQCSKKSNLTRSHNLECEVALRYRIPNRIVTMLQSWQLWKRRFKGWSINFRKKSMSWLICGKNTLFWERRMIDWRKRKSERESCLRGSTIKSKVPPRRNGKL